ncbi:putative peptidoglycan lipid II flippase [Sinosporangium album]|uniref:Probable lipid II flippase MurJ n=1 Tax=Sinosporangium album TaxID=504805 RepID=A0A1G8EST6_9ACTN|nr:murein biosynthesis integral membrane protein MurJ [Sinosporangium album]SDH72988.1 putative peptidoglycan lipid II flippase [Sinosporangium album]
MSRLLRAGAIMAAGTMVSRLTGFLRTAVLAAAIGTATLGDAYNVAYTIPYILFDLLIGGVLSSVVVPMIVRRQKSDPDGGRAYEQRLLTIATIALIAVSALAVVLAGPLIQLYTSELSEKELRTATVLAQMILPQIAFFGLGALAGAILNTRDRFGAPMWAPVLNNIVVIGVGVTYLNITDGQSNIDNVTSGQLALLGLGTTAGIVAQSIVLVVSLRRAGFSFRPRLGLREAGLGEMARLGGWSLAYVAITQAGFVVTTKLSTGAGALAFDEGVPYGAGLTAYNIAYQLFQLPYGIIAVSVITATLPNMSRFVHDGRLADASEAFMSGVRLVCSAIVPASLLLMVLGPSLTVLVFAHGVNTVADAVYIGNVLQVYALAMVPFTLFQMLLRVFYSFADTRTPVMFAAMNVAINAGLSLVAFYTLPPGFVVMGLGAAFTVTYTVAAAVAWRMASRRVGGLSVRVVAAALSRMFTAALPAVLVALAVLWGVDRAFGLTPLSSAVVLAAGGGLGGMTYLVIAHRLRIPEVNSIVGMVAGRVGR